MKRPTPPDARGVGTKSKTYPGMQEKRNRPTNSYVAQKLHNI